MTLPFFFFFCDCKNPDEYGSKTPTFDRSEELEKMEQEYANAQYLLDQIYKNGYGTLKGGDQEANDKITVELMRSLASKGNVAAQVLLGVMYMEGRGVAKDKGKAVEWFQKAVGLFQQAADKGDIYAQYGLGLMYMRGRGVPKDDQKAAEWFQKAADKGYRRARSKLEWLYENGYIAKPMGTK